MTCPLLSYRRSGDGRTFDEARAYCTAVERFVQPMRADVCNDRYDLAHAEHCELYREHAGDAVTAVESRVETPGDSPDGGATDGDDTDTDEDATGGDDTDEAESER